MDIKIYVANLGAYNRGCLVGKWLGLPMDEDELQEEIEDILHGEEAQKTQSEYDCDEEVAIHDYECDIEGFEIGEYESIRELNEAAEAIGRLHTYQQDILEAILEWDASYFRSLQGAVDSVDDCHLYHGVETLEDLGYYVVDEGLFGQEIPSSLYSYIDFEAIGREWDMDTQGGFTTKGYLEICN